MLFLLLIATCMLATNAQFTPVNLLVNGGCEALGTTCSTVTTCSQSSALWMLPTSSSCGSYCTTGNTRNVANFLGWSQSNIGVNSTGFSCVYSNISESPVYGGKVIGLPYEGNSFFAMLTPRCDIVNSMSNTITIPANMSSAIKDGLVKAYLFFAMSFGNSSGIQVFFQFFNGVTQLQSNIIVNSATPTGVIPSSITWQTASSTNVLPAATNAINVFIRPKQTCTNGLPGQYVQIDGVKVYVFSSACIGFPPFPIGQTNTSACNSTYTVAGRSCVLQCLPSYINTGGNFTAVCNNSWTANSQVSNNWIVGTGSCTPTNSYSHSLSHKSLSHNSRSHNSHSTSHESKSATHHSHSTSHHSASHESPSMSHSYGAYDKKPVNLIANSGCELPGYECGNVQTCGLPSNPVPYLPCLGWKIPSTSTQCGMFCNNGTAQVSSILGWQSQSNDLGLPSAGWACVYGNLVQPPCAGGNIIGSPHTGNGFFAATGQFELGNVYLTQNVTLTDVIPASVIDAGLGYYYTSGYYACANNTNVVFQNRWTNSTGFSTFIRNFRCNLGGNIPSSITWLFNTFSGTLAPTARGFTFSLLAFSTSNNIAYYSLADDIVLYVFTSTCIGYPIFPYGQTYSSNCNSSYTMKGGICTLQCLSNYMPSGGNFTAVCNSTWTTSSNINNNWLLTTGSCVPTNSESHSASHKSHSHQSDSKSHSKSHESDSHSKSHESDSHSKSHESDSHSKSHESDSHSKSHESDSYSRSKSSSLESKSHSHSESVSLSSPKCSSTSHIIRDDVYAFNNHSIVNGTADVPTCPVQLEVSLTNAYNAFAGVILSAANVTVNGDVNIVNVTAQIVLYLTDFHQQLAANFSCVEQAIQPAVLLVNGCNQYQQVSSVSLASSVRYLDVPHSRDFTVWCRQSFVSKLPLVPYFQYDVVFPNLALPSALTRSRQNQTALAIVMKGLMHDDSFFIDGITVGYSDGTIVTIPTISCDSYMLDTFQCQCTNYYSCDLGYATSPIMFDNAQILQP